MRREHDLFFHAIEHAGDRAAIRILVLVDHGVEERLRLVAIIENSLAIALVCVILYPITKSLNLQIQNELEARRNKAAAT